MDTQHRPRTSAAGSWGVMSDMSDEPSISSMSSLDPRFANTGNNSNHPGYGTTSPRESFGESIWFSGPLSLSRRSVSQDVKEPVSMFARLARPITPTPLRRRMERQVAERNVGKHPSRNGNPSSHPLAEYRSRPHVAGRPLISCDASPDDEDLRFVDASDDLPSSNVLSRHSNNNSKSITNSSNGSTSPTSTITTDVSEERALDSENAACRTSCTTGAYFDTSAPQFSSNEQVMASQQRSVPKRLPRTKVFYQKKDVSNAELHLKAESSAVGGVRAVIGRFERQDKIATKGLGHESLTASCLEELNFDETINQPPDGEEGQLEARFWLDGAYYLEDDEEEYESSDEGDVLQRNRLDPDVVRNTKEKLKCDASGRSIEDAPESLSDGLRGAVPVVEAQKLTPSKDQHSTSRAISHSLRAFAPARRAISALKQQAAALAEQQPRDGQAANLLRPLTPLSQRKHPHQRDRPRPYSAAVGLESKEHVQHRIREQVRMHSNLASDSLSQAAVLNIVPDDARTIAPVSGHAILNEQRNKKMGNVQMRQLVPAQHLGAGGCTNEAAMNVAAGHRNQFIDLMSVAADAQARRSKPGLFSKGGISRLGRRLGRYH